MKTINWHITETDRQWAFGNLARSVQSRTKDFRHVFQEPGHINIIMTPVHLGQIDIDQTCILHLDGNRWYEHHGVKIPGRATVLNVIWELDSWSWGLCYANIQSELERNYNMTPIEFKPYARNGCQLPMDGVDFVLCQNITQVHQVPDDMKRKTITRLGGIMNFKTGNDKVDFYFEQMRQCGAIIATNSKLYDIAKQANPNSYLIPNGIDIRQWCPRPDRVWDYKNPVIGFIGNVANLAKVQYKGYDLVCKAVRDMGLTLRQGLFKSEQIPHDQMKELFYDEIDILILPTDGEGCSNTIMEAMSCGVPVITTRTSGYHGERCVDGENIIFVEKSLIGVKHGITRFLNSPDLYQKIGDGGRAFAITHHDVNIVAAQYREVFERHFK